jgi:hypothetical protein
MGQEVARIVPGGKNNRQLHQPWALTSGVSILGFDASTVERAGFNYVAGSEVDWVMRSARRLGERPDPKKPTALRGVSRGLEPRKR